MTLQTNDRIENPRVVLTDKQRRVAPLQATQTNVRWKSPSMLARYIRSDKALEAIETLV